MLYSRLEIFPIGGEVGTNGNLDFKGGAEGLCFLYVLQNQGFADAHNGFDACGLAAVDDVFGGEQVGGRDGGGAQAMEGQAGKPKLIASFEDEHDFIAPLYP